MLSAPILTASRIQRGIMTLCATSLPRLLSGTAHGTLLIAPSCPAPTARALRARNAGETFARRLAWFSSIGAKSRCAHSPRGEAGTRRRWMNEARNAAPPHARYGCAMRREGSEHSLWENPRTGHAEAAPRHSEVQTCWPGRYIASFRFPTRPAGLVEYHPSLDESTLRKLRLLTPPREWPPADPPRQPSKAYQSPTVYHSFGGRR